MSAAGGGQSFSIAAFYSKYGLKGFASQGVFPEIVKSSVMRVSKFFFFPIICENVWKEQPNNLPGWKKGIAGALATVPEIVMISPIEVAKIGMQLDHENKFNNNSRAFVRHIYKTKGIAGLYTGWAGMQYRQSVWTGTFFATLSFWKDHIERPLKEHNCPAFVAGLASGFVAGFVAAIPNCPGDVVRSVVQKRLFAEEGRRAHGISLAGILEHVEVARSIARERGVTALWSGIGFKAMHLGGSGALMAVLIPFFAKAMNIQYGGV